MKSERSKLSRHADVARAMDYMLKRWPAFTIDRAAIDPRRRADLSHEQRSRTSAARRGDAAFIVPLFFKYL
jgi:hypothetical protein